MLQAHGILMEPWETTVLTGMWREGAGLMRFQEKNQRQLGTALGPQCYILAKNVTMFYLCPNTLSKAKS